MTERLELGRPIWGLPHITKMLGVSVDTARSWARKPDVPIYRPEGSGQYMAFKVELTAWLRGKAGRG